jgi:hypothetical protein
MRARNKEGIGGVVLGGLAKQNTETATTSSPQDMQIGGYTIRRRGGRLLPRARARLAWRVLHAGKAQGVALGHQPAITARLYLSQRLPPGPGDPVTACTHRPSFSPWVSAGSLAAQWSLTGGSVISMGPAVIEEKGYRCGLSGVRTGRFGCAFCYCCLSSIQNSESEMNAR